MSKKKLNVLVIRGYYSKGNSLEYLNINNIEVKVTTVALGRPVLVKRKLQKIINKYKVCEHNRYDLIYAISMSSCISSLVDEKVHKKLHLITPFFLHYKTISVLARFKIRKMLGAYLLLLLNGKLGDFHKDVRVTLAEKDKIVDNKFFACKWSNVNWIKGIDHHLPKEVFEDILVRDINNLINLNQLNLLSS
ncbi:MAG: hypothetical protein Kow0076_4120 [Francisella sp.]